MGKLLESKSLNIPEPATLEGCEYEPLHYFLLGDEVFSLKEYMMRPFPGQLDEDQKVSTTDSQDEEESQIIHSGF